MEVVNKQQSPTNHAKIPALDGVRGIAILTVMISHFIFLSWPNTPAYRVLQGGWLGVDLFFVLSGFLITGILLDTKNRPGYFSRFYSRRALRIFPLYFFAILFVWAFVVFVERAPERLQGYDSWWWYLTFTSNIAMAFKDNWTFHSYFLDANHLWSIAVEEQFYVIWPLIVWVLPARWLLVLCAVLVHFSTPIRHFTDEQFGHPWHLASYMLPYCRMDGLAAGSFLAVLLRLDWPNFLPGKTPQIFSFLKNVDSQKIKILATVAFKWFARVLVVWMAVRLLDAFWNGSTQYLGTMSALLFAPLVFLALSTDNQAITRRICEWGFLRHLGKYSYGLYVFHHLAHEIWQKQIGDRLIASGLNIYAAQLIYIFLAFGMTYGLARLSWRFIEEPFLRMKK